MTTTRSGIERTFDTYLRLFAPDLPAPICEFRFHPTRRWRFDRAWPEAWLAVELEGGIWSNGRHTRAAGYQADCEKYNAAIVAGWRILRFTSDMLHADPESCIALIKRLYATHLRTEEPQ